MLSQWLNLPRHGLEISDAIVSFDPNSLERTPVFKSDLIEHFVSKGNLTAVKIINKIPENEGFLDSQAVDKLLITAHCEMQRLSEEFQHGRRVAELLKPIICSLKNASIQRKIRIVDIGCGTGFVLRWLATNNVFENVELIGADFNPALVKEATRLAKAENLHCKFVVANAFQLNQPADIYLSTGILHHFRGESLKDFFSQLNASKPLAFIHFDFYKSFFAPFGSWLFHAARMREPLANHDGILSAMRAYKSIELLETAKITLPDFALGIYGVRLWMLPIPRVFHSLVGIRPEFKNDFLKNLGKWRIFSLGVME